MRSLFAFGIKFEKNKLKMLSGLLLALISTFCWLMCFPGSTVAAAMAALFAAAFLMVGCLRFDAKTERAAGFLNILWGIVSIVAVMAISLPLAFPADFLYKSCLNLLCALVMAACFFAITASWRAASNLTISALALLIGVNLVVFALRGKELAVGDFRAAQTALSVVGQYSFPMTKKFLCLCSIYILMMFSQFSIPCFPARKTPVIRLRAAGLLAAVFMVLLLNAGSAGISIKGWGTEGTDFNGYLLNFYLGIRDSFVEEPDNYSLETVEEFSAAYAEETKESAEKVKPNIIVIMDEAFSDLNIYERPLTTNVPVTPFIDSLSENVVKGYALTSIFGGKTANSEFEFLTGHTMGFLPSDSVPYQQYIFEDICSIAHVLNTYGYASFATHPYLATGWSRSTVYPYLGLSDFTFIEDYPQESIMRTYVSDQEMFEYVLEHLNAERGEAPLFLMGVTMQNHGGYQYEGKNFTKTIELEGFSREYPEVEQYLSLLRETDRAVEYLLTELQNYPEDTIVVFFGDHQPNLGTAILEELNGGAFDTLDERMLQYTVPFFIWANFDIEEDFISCTSINYLPRYVLECAGLELPAITAR